MSSISKPTSTGVRPSCRTDAGGWWVSLGRWPPSPLLLLDEPAAGLDERETTELGELIQRLATEWGMGVLLIEHDVALVMRICHRIYALNFGATIASGSADEVRRSPAVIEAYLGAGTAEEPAGTTIQ